MKQLKFFLILLLAIGRIYANDKVVYGEDNRLDIFEVKGLFLKRLSDSTAAMVPKKSLVIKNGMVNIEGISLKEDLNLCPGERFEDQKNPAYCSGFLFGERLLITAGHCATQHYCDTQDWVFGMYQQKDTNELNVPIENIYSCNKIIARSQNRSNLEDWAVIELDRRVSGIPHILVREEGEIPVGTELVVIGHPSGLPTKVAAGAFVRKN